MARIVAPTYGAPREIIRLGDRAENYFFFSFLDVHKFCHCAPFPLFPLFLLRCFSFCDDGAYVFPAPVDQSWAANRQHQMLSLV
jgi:hypothetical protein